MSTAPISVETLLAHRAWVKAVARAVVRDPNAADDVEQETWLAALATPPRHAGSLRGWLGAVARSRARRIGRGDGRRSTRESSAARGEATPSAGDLAEIADTHRRVVAAVVELAEPYRQTILLRYFEGLAVEDVAKRTDVPIDTARSRISRGLAKLRERLDRELGGDDRPLALALAPLFRGEGESAATAAGTGAVVATKAVWAAAAVFAVAAIGGVVAMRWSADVPAVVAAAPPVAPMPAPPPPPAPVEEANPKPVAPPVPRVRADEPKSEPPPAVPETAAQKLETKFSVEWKDTPLVEILGEISAKADVDIFAAEEVLTQTEDCAPTLRLDGVTAKTMLRLLSTMGAFHVDFEETRVVCVPGDGKRDETRALVLVPRITAESKRTLLLNGVVVDGSGAPIANAAVMRVDAGKSAPIATTDEHGAFAVDVARPYPQVFASAPGRASSGIAPVRGKSGDTQSLRLVLGGGAATVDVLVLDDDGRGVADARVSIVNHAAGRNGDRQGLRTDASGWLRAEGIPAGRLRVEASIAYRAKTGKATLTTQARVTSARVEAAPGATAFVEVRLARLLKWSGTVRDPAGRPVAGVLIQGSGTEVTSGADGAFVCDVTNAGTAHVRLTLPDGRRTDRYVTVEPGRDLTQDLVVGAGWRIAGKVIGITGAAGRKIWLMNVLPWASPRFLPAWPVSLSKEGHFAFEDVAPGRYRISVPSDVGGFADVVSEEIDRSRDDLVLTVGPERRPVAGVRARLVLADGAAAAAARVAFSEAALFSFSGSATVGADGRVTTSLAPPGRHRLYATVPSGRACCLVLDAGVLEIGRADVDLGTLTFAAPGRVRVRWDVAAELSAAPVSMRLTRDGVGDLPPIGAGHEDCDAIDLAPEWTLSPGRYTVRVVGAGVQGVERTFDVTENGGTDLDMPMRAAPRRTVRLRFPLGPPACCRVRISDAAGGFAYEESLQMSEFAAPLLPGRYRVDVDVTETITVHGTLDVPDASVTEALGVVLR